MELPYLAAAFIKTLSDVLSKPVLRIGTKGGRAYVDIVYDASPRQSVDDRIAKIDAARANLADALEAIDGLKEAATANKLDLQEALEQLGHTQKQHNVAIQRLGAVRQIAEADVEAFRELAGVPSRSQIAKERALGFVFGIVASIVASGLWWGFTKLWPILKT